MKIAVTYENGQVFQHFGHTEQFKIYEAAEGKVVSARVVETGGSGHGALAGFLRGLGVDTLICGGIGGGARSALAEAGIQLYPGASGSADAQVEALLAAWPTIPTPYAATTTTVRGIPADTITRAVTPAAAMTTAADITADWA